MPDVDVLTLQKGVEVTQTLLQQAPRSPLLAGHDVSDGGPLVTALEMAFATPGVGLSLDFAASHSDTDDRVLAALFAEEPGWIFQVPEDQAEEVLRQYRDQGVRCSVVGRPTAATGGEGSVAVSVGGVPVHLSSDGSGGSSSSSSGGGGGGSTVRAWRAVWEETAFALEDLQCATECVRSEEAIQATRKAPAWKLTYTPSFTAGVGVSHGSDHPGVGPDQGGDRERPKVMILREEGSNGDREMAAVVAAAGMEPWDVHMSDLLQGKISDLTHT